MEKLSFTYSERRGEYVAAVPGFTIAAVRDEYPENPYKAFDGQPPLLVYSQDGLTEYGDIPNPLAGLSDSWIARKWGELCAIFEAPPSEAKRAKEDGSYFRIADARRDLIDTWLGESKPGKWSNGSAREYWRIMQALCELRAWPVYVTCERGYSQGDWADCQAIMSPEYAESIGRHWPKSKADKAAALDSLKADCKLYGDWAFGRVYGFKVSDSQGEELDSCYGFYGEDFNASGLADAALMVVEYHKESRRKARTAKLAALIRARVPLHDRERILKGFPL